MSRPTRFLVALAGAIALSTGLATASSAAQPDSIAQPSIVGGVPAPAGTWPSIVALMKSAVPDDWSAQSCGGTIVTPVWVLTAAHCTAGKAASDLQVLVGTHRLDNSGTRVNVAEIHNDPAYSPTTAEADLSLLKLAAPVAQPALPVAAPGLAPLWAAGRTAHVAGWGNQDPSGSEYPTDLYQVDVPLITDAQCASAYGSRFYPASMLCAGDVVNGGIDACQGDSGGPMTVDDAAGHRLLAGNVSWGDGCAQAAFPGIYGRLANMRAFIDATIGWTGSAHTGATPLAYDGAYVGQRSPTQTATFTSDGTAPVAVADVTLAGADPGQFAIVSDGCSLTSLLPGESCQVTVAAQPTRTGDAAARLTFDADTASAAPDVALASTGARIALAPPVPTPTTTTTPDAAPTPPAAEPTPAPAPVPPVATPRTTDVVPTVSLRTIRADRGGVRRLAVTLSAPGSVDITLIAHRRVRGRVTTVKVGSAGASFDTAGRRVLDIELTRAGRRLVAQGARLMATAKVTVSAGRADTTATTRVTVADRR